MAFDSGGAHCLKYGMTSNHVLGLKVVLPDGEVVELGGASLKMYGVDLPGSAGTYDLEHPESPAPCRIARSTPS